jgi:integrase
MTGQQEPEEPTDKRKDGKSVAQNKKRSYGSGCLIKRGKGFAIRWRETRVLLDGTKQFVNRCEAVGNISKTKAVEILNEKLAATRTEHRAVITFAELAAAWKATVLPMYKHSSRLVRGDTVTKKLIPRFGTSELSQVNTQEIQRFIADLNREGYAPHTVHGVHNVLSGVMGKAVTWGYLKENPAHRVDLPKLVPLRSKWVLSREQAKQLLEVLPTMARAMVGLSILTGIRRGELFALRWKSLDEAAGCLEIAEAVYLGHFDTPKTEMSKRLLPLSKASLTMLAAWKRISKRTGPEDLLFGTRTGKAQNPNNVLRRYLYPACKRLGMPQATWLTFRRTFASWSHNTGAPSKVTAELMGHARVYTTLNVYTQVMVDALRPAVDRIGEELFATCSHSEQKARFVN